MSRWQDRDARRERQQTAMAEHERQRMAFEAQSWDRQVEQSGTIEELKEVLIRFIRHHDLE